MRIDLSKYLRPMARFATGSILLMALVYPRAGLAASVAEALVNAGPLRGLAYVSCDPATLARDLARLSSAFRPVDVRAFDAFPQTAHVETVVWLERVDGDSSPGTEMQ